MLKSPMGPLGSEAPRRHHAARSTARLEASVREEHRCGSNDGSSPHSCWAVETQPEKESTLHRHLLACGARSWL